MNAHALTLFKVFQKQFSEEDAGVLVESIEQITKKKITEQEDYTTKSIQHQVEQKIDFLVERKIEKEHKYLATKEDIMEVKEEFQGFKEYVYREFIAVREDIMEVKEELQNFKEYVYREFVAVREDIVSVKEDIISVKEDVVSVRGEIISVKEELKEDNVKLREMMIKQHRSFLTLNITIFAIITTILIYLVTKIP